MAICSDRSGVLVRAAAGAAVVVLVSIISIVSPAPVARAAGTLVVDLQVPAGPLYLGRTGGVPRAREQHR